MLASFKKIYTPYADSLMFEKNGGDSAKKWSWVYDSSMVAIAGGTCGLPAIQPETAGIWYYRVSKT